VIAVRQTLGSIGEAAKTANSNSVTYRFSLARSALVAVSGPKATTAVLERLTTLLKTFPAYAQVRVPHLSLEPWRKANRTRLETRVAPEMIRELYQPMD
jgi:hypothetical protein